MSDEYSVRSILDERTRLSNGKRIEEVKISWKPCWILKKNVGNDVLKSKDHEIVGVHKDSVTEKSGVRGATFVVRVKSEGTFDLWSYNELKATFPELLLDYLTEEAESTWKEDKAEEKKEKKKNKGKKGGKREENEEETEEGEGEDEIFSDEA